MAEKKQVWTINTVEYEALIQLLKRARLKARISQRKLSAELEQTRSYMHMVEKGTRRIDLVEFVAIAEALKLDPGELFEEYLRLIGRRKRR